MFLEKALHDEEKHKILRKKKEIKKEEFYKIKICDSVIMIKFHDKETKKKSFIKVKNL